LDPFFRTLVAAVMVIVSFFVAVLCGRLIAVRTTREKNAQQLVTGLATLAIFLVMFFVGRRLLAA
jgi:ABC-type Na+ efflux pump permease subunit